MQAGARGRWEATFAPETDAAHRSRCALAAALAAADVPPDRIADAVLVLSELVANAVRHARTVLTASAAIEGDLLRIEVLDHDTRPPALMGLDANSTSGRGLHIVAAIAEDWGWNTADGEAGVPGKVVWAELALAELPTTEGEGSGGE